MTSVDNDADVSAMRIREKPSFDSIRFGIIGIEFNSQKIKNNYERKTDTLWKHN